MKKYELTRETKIIINVFGEAITLYRIRAVIDFASIKAGDVGGWIESEKNLSHKEKAWVCDDAEVYGNAEVFAESHVLVIGAIGSRNAFTTFYRDKDNDITVSCGCFNGKLAKFLDKVTQTHEGNKHASVYRAAAELAKLQINLSGETMERRDRP